MPVDGSSNALAFLDAPFHAGSRKISHRSTSTRAESASLGEDAAGQVHGDVPTRAASPDGPCGSSADGDLVQRLVTCLAVTYALENDDWLYKQVKDVLSPSWLESAQYPFAGPKRKVRLPLAGEWQPKNYRFAAYAQLTRIVYEGLDRLGAERPDGKLSWDSDDIIVHCIKDVYGDPVDIVIDDSNAKRACVGS